MRETVLDRIATGVISIDNEGVSHLEFRGHRLLGMIRAWTAARHRGVRVTGDGAARSSRTDRGSRPRVFGSAEVSLVRDGRELHLLVG
jgi:hypothetical protein